MKKFIHSLILVLCITVSLFAFQTGNRYNGEVFTFEEELSIGVGDGAEEYMFTFPVDIEIDSKGNIYVSDFMENCVKVYNSNGVYVITIGRKGKGPGEFSRLSNIDIDSEDSLYAMDFENRRISVFTRKGEFQKSFNFPDFGKYMKIPNDAMRVLNGNFLIIDSKSDYSSGERRSWKEINLYSENMELLRTIYSAEENYRKFVMKNGKRFAIDHPYPYSMEYGFVNDNILIYGLNDTYKFYIHDIMKNVTKEVTGEYKAIEVSKKDKEDYFSELEKDMEHEYYKSRGVTIKYMKEETFFPKEKPPYRKLIDDDTGYLIFVTYEEDKKKGTACDLYDIEGNFIKKIYFTNLYGRIKFKNGQIYSIVRPEDDFPRVVRLKMVRVK